MIEGSDHPASMEQGSQADLRELRSALATAESESLHLKSALHAMPVAWAEHRMVFDAHGRPSDYVFLDVNPTFERWTGLRAEHILGKHVTEIIPELRKEEPDLIELYGQVVLDGRERKFEFYFAQRERWYGLTAFRSQPGHFTVLFEDITERKHAERELLESERQHRLLFDHMLAGYAFCRFVYEQGVPVDFIYLDVNPAFQQLTGLREVIGKTFNQLTSLHSESRLKMFELYARVAESGAPERVDTYVDWLDMWLDISVYSPAPEHFVAVFDNITDRKRVIEGIRRSEEQFRNFFEGAPIGKAIAAPDGRIERVNAALCRMLGYSSDELCSMTWTEFTHPADLQTGLDAQRALLRGEEKLVQFEKRYIGKGGGTFWVDVRVTPLYDSAGNVTRFVTYVFDISERKHAEQMLSRSERTLRRLVDGLKNECFFYGRGPDGMLNYVSESIFDVLGYSPDEFCALDAAAARGGPLDATWAEFKKLGIDGVKAPSNPLEVRGKDGRLHWLELVEFPIMDDARLLGVEGIARDVSARNSLQLELNHVRKLQAIGQLAAGIAHEINTPMQYIGDNVRFLKQGADDVAALVAKYREALSASDIGADFENARRELEALEREIDLEDLLRTTPTAFDSCFEGISRISAIVRAMKEFAHPDRRDKQLANVNQALETTLIIARNEYKYVADVETALSELPPISCHVSDLNQVFLNLIVNAAHAIADVVGESGERGAIRVSTRQDGDDVCIEVADTGAGIPENIRERIFDPFFTTKAVGKGSGQGLAISRAIVVEKHGGSLTFDSVVGRGTTFRIKLPIGAAPGA